MSEPGRAGDPPLSPAWTNGELGGLVRSARRRGGRQGNGGRARHLATAAAAHGGGGGRPLLLAELCLLTPNPLPPLVIRPLTRGGER